MRQYQIMTHFSPRRKADHASILQIGAGGDTRTGRGGRRVREVGSGGTHDLRKQGSSLPWLESL
jgi:hypothetical protein